MAMRIVMDSTGDSRHHFDPNDAQEVAKAERRFYELTKLGFTAAARTGPGQVSLECVSTDAKRQPRRARRVPFHVSHVVG